MVVFEEMVRKFVRQVQGRCSSDQGWIPARIDDSRFLQNSDRSYLVIKSRKGLFQRQACYRVSRYTLEDLMEHAPRPVWKTGPYNLGEFRVSVVVRTAAGVGVDGPPGGGGAVVQHNVELTTVFDALDVHDMKDVLDMKDSISDAIRKKPKKPLLDLKKGDTLVLVTAKMVTTTPSPVRGVDQVDASVMAKVKAQLGKVFGGVTHHRTVEIEGTINGGTVLAYCVEQHGDLTALCSPQNNLQTDCSEALECLLEEYTSGDDLDLDLVWKALRDLEEKLQSLAGLQPEEKAQLCLALKDRTDSQNLLENTIEHDESPVTSAKYLLVSAFEELPAGMQDMLAECSPEDLQALDTLVNTRKANEPASPEPMANPLQEFLCSSNETLQSMQETLWEETGLKPGPLLLILCIAVQGLAQVKLTP